MTQRNLQIYLARDTSHIENPGLTDPDEADGYIYCDRSNDPLESSTPHEHYQSH